MEQEDRPASLVIIGGGYVGMEQAQLFAGLGVTVTIVGNLAPGGLRFAQDSDYPARGAA